MSPTVFIGSAAVVGSLWVLWWAVSGEQTDSIRLRVRAGIMQAEDRRAILLRQSARERATRPVIDRLVARIQRLMPRGRVAAMAAKIQHAGSPKGWTVERIFGVKIVLMLFFGVFFGLRLVADPGAGNMALLVGASAFGFFAPEGVLDARANKRKAMIRADVADTIDQIGVMVRAGLAIDAAIARTARDGNGPLADEFARVVQDVRVGIGRSVALANMANRADVPELGAFVAALAQAEKLGVPISQTLEIQAGELRLKRRQVAEEQAMKLPVKILFPMVVFILPVIFIVLLGPAAIRIMEQFSK